MQQAHTALRSLTAALVLLSGIALALSLAARGARAGDGSDVVASDLRLAVFSQGEWHQVDVSILVVVDSRDRVGAVREAEDSIIARFPLVVRQELSSDVSGYVVNGYSWTSHNAHWSYNPAGKPAGLDGDAAAVAGGAGQWAATGADFSFSNDGGTAASTGACNGDVSGLDGANTVGWGSQDGNILAVTCTWYEGSAAVEFDMRLDPDWNWTTAETGVQIDLYSVATHEFGHALGLGHSNDRTAVMYASYANGSLKRVPLCDDIRGAVAIYGGTIPPVCTPTPVTFDTATPTPTGTPTPVPIKQPRTPTPTPALPSPTPTVTPTPFTTAGSTLVLRPGGNLATWPALPDGPRRALGNTVQVQAVYRWDPGSGDWLRWLPPLPDTANSLRELRPGEAYWFMVEGSGEVRLSFEGQGDR